MDFLYWLDGMPFAVVIATSVATMMAPKTLECVHRSTWTNCYIHCYIICICMYVFFRVLREGDHSTFSVCSTWRWLPQRIVAHFSFTPIIVWSILVFFTAKHSVNEIRSNFKDDCACAPVCMCVRICVEWHWHILRSLL